jgi:hypothetical protein
MADGSCGKSRQILLGAIAWILPWELGIRILLYARAGIQAAPQRPDTGQPPNFFNYHAGIPQVFFVTLELRNSRIFREEHP